MCTPIISSETNQNPSQESFWSAGQILRIPGILENVLSFLPSPQDRSTAAQICKFWRSEVYKIPCKNPEKILGLPISISSIDPTQWKLLNDIFKLGTTYQKWSFSPPKVSQIRWGDLSKLYSVAKNALDIINKQNSEGNCTNSQTQSTPTIKLVIIHFPGNLNLLEDRLLFPCSKENCPVNTPSYLTNETPHRSIVCLNVVLPRCKGPEQKSQIKKNPNGLTLRLVSPMESLILYIFHMAISTIKERFFLIKKIETTHKELFTKALYIIYWLNEFSKVFIEIERLLSRINYEKFNINPTQDEIKLLDVGFYIWLKGLEEDTENELKNLLPNELQDDLPKIRPFPFVKEQTHLSNSFKLRTMEKNKYFHLRFQYKQPEETLHFEHSIETFGIAFPSTPVSNYRSQNRMNFPTLIAADLPYTFELPNIQESGGRKRKLEG